MANGFYLLETFRCGSSFSLCVDKCVFVYSKSSVRLLQYNSKYNRNSNRSKPAEMTVHGLQTFRDKLFRKLYNCEQTECKQRENLHLALTTSQYGRCAWDFDIEWVCEGTVLPEKNIETPTEPANYVHNIIY